MNVYFKCDSCGFKINKDMRYAIENELCPSCGNKISTENVDSAFLLLDVISEAKLPLNEKEIMILINKFLIEKLEMKLPKIHIELDTKEKIAFSSKQSVRKQAIETTHNSVSDEQGIVEGGQKVISPTDDPNSVVSELKNGAAKEANKDGIHFLDPQKFGVKINLAEEFKSGVQDLDSLPENMVRKIKKEPIEKEDENFYKGV